MNGQFPGWDFNPLVRRYTRHTASDARCKFARRKRVSIPYKEEIPKDVPPKYRHAPGRQPPSPQTEHFDKSSSESFHSALNLSSVINGTITARP